MPRPLRPDSVPVPAVPRNPPAGVEALAARVFADGVVTPAETNELLATMGSRPLTAAEAAAVRRAMELNLDRFDPASRVIIRDYLDHRLPRVIVDNQPVDPISGGGVPANAAKLSWTPPTQNTDGSPLTDLGGYKVYYGTTPGSYTNELTINDPSATSHTISNLPPGTWYFAMRAFDTSGNQSALTGEVSKTIH